MGEVGSMQAFLRSKSGHFSIFCFLLLVFCFGVCSPALNSAGASIFWKKAVRAGGVAVVVPRWWKSLADTSVLAAYTPCLTVFCSTIRSSMELRIVPALQGYQKGWMSRAESVLAERRFASLGTRTIETGAGVMQCLGAKDGDAQGVVLWACMANDSGVVATFKGSPSDLNDFNRMVVSTKVLAVR